MSFLPDSAQRALRHAIYGCLSSAYNGGISAVAGITGIDVVAVSGTTDKAHLLTIHEMGAAFCGAFVLHAFLWLVKHPLPEKIDTNPPIPPPSA